MKKILTIALCFMLTTCVVAQNEYMSISMANSNPQSTKNTEALLLLRKRLASVVANSGLGMADYCGIVMFPTISITNKQMIEGGMRKIVVYDIDLSIFVSQMITGADFNYINISLRGEGYTEETAMVSAVNRITNNDERLTNFFINTKNKILNYYRNNLKTIITKANTLAQMQQYEEAIALLYSYPETLSREYEDIAKEMRRIYALYQQKNCREILQKARGEYATGNYDEAILWLNQIDMLSPCAEETNILTNKIKSAVDADRRQEFEMYQQQLRNEADIEKQRIKAIENIVTAYYKQSSKCYFIF